MRLLATAWTSRFLGTERHIRQLLDFVEQLDGGSYRPERWSFFEPLRQTYDGSAAVKDRIVQGWIEERPPGSGRVVNQVLLKKLGGAMEMKADCWRSWHPGVSLNFVELRISVAASRAATLGEAICRELSGVVNADLVTVRSSEQALSRAVGGTPLHRLRQVDWLMYWGAAYIDLLGEDRILAAPFCRAERSVGGGLFTWVTEAADDSRISSSPEAQEKIERFLGGELFPDGSSIDNGVVPKFDLAELRIREPFGNRS